MESINSNQIYTNELLKFIIEQGNITTTDILELTEKMRIEKVKKLHNYAINKLGDERFKTTVKTADGRKSIVAKTEKDLWKKLADWYETEEKTFEVLFNEMCDYRLKLEKVEEKTIKEYKNVFKRFFSDTDMITKSLSQINLNAITKFLDEAHKRTTVKGVKKKRISKNNQRDIKAVINKTYAYANNVLGMEIACPMSLVDFSDYKVDDKLNNSHYTEEERIKLLDYLATIPDEKKDCYDLAIELDFELGLRIGELKALRYDDFKDDFVHIHAQILEKIIDGHKQNIYVDYVKTQNEEGERYLPLSHRAKEILERIKSLHFDNDFLFKKQGRFMLTCTFNRHLEKHCPKAGIPYRSSHKIRFGFATRLIANNCPLNVASSILGHTNVQTTSRYVKVVQKAEQNKEMLNYMGA